MSCFQPGTREAPTPAGRFPRVCRRTHTCQVPPRGCHGRPQAHARGGARPAVQALRAVEAARGKHVIAALVQPRGVRDRARARAGPARIRAVGRAPRGAAGVLHVHLRRWRRRRRRRRRCLQRAGGRRTRSRRCRSCRGGAARGSRRALLLQARARIVGAGAVARPGALGGLPGLRARLQLPCSLPFSQSLSCRSQVQCKKLHVSDTHGRAGRTRASGLPAGELAAPTSADGTACAMRQKSHAPFAPPAPAGRAAAGRVAPAAAALAAPRGRAGAAPWVGARAWPVCRAAPRVGLGTCEPARGGERVLTLFKPPRLALCIAHGQSGTHPGSSADRSPLFAGLFLLPGRDSSLSSTRRAPARNEHVCPTRRPHDLKGAARAWLKVNTPGPAAAGAPLPRGDVSALRGDGERGFCEAKVNALGAAAAGAPQQKPNAGGGMGGGAAAGAAATAGAAPVAAGR